MTSDYRVIETWGGRVYDCKLYPCTVGHDEEVRHGRQQEERNSTFRLALLLNWTVD